MPEEAEKALLSRLESGARKAGRTGLPVPGRFIARDRYPDAVHIARMQSVACSTFGGYPLAERVQVCFHPEDEEPVFTGVWVKIAWNAHFSSLTHPELLGSLMALGTDRSYYGDLLCGADQGQLFCLPEIAARLPQEWTQAGRVPIRVREVSGTPELALPRGDMVSVTVASLRLDGILASALPLSRAKCQDLIRQGLVMVNHIPTERVDREIAEGDLVSVRGYGRVRLQEVRGLTRKDRMAVTLEKLLHK